MFRARATVLLRACILFSLCLALLPGCATTASYEDYKDPFEKYNRAVYKFNDGFDRALLKPIANPARSKFPYILGPHRVFNAIESIAPSMPTNQFFIHLQNVYAMPHSSK